jgi:hypothetical protein
LHLSIWHKYNQRVVDVSAHFCTAQIGQIDPQDANFQSVKTSKKKSAAFCTNWMAHMVAVFVLPQTNCASRRWHSHWHAGQSLVAFQLLWVAQRTVGVAGGRKEGDQVMHLGDG